MVRANVSCKIKKGNVQLSNVPGSSGFVHQEGESMKRIAAVVASLTLMSAAPAVAAESSTCPSYSPDCNSISHFTTTTTTSSGTLPFTGLDVVLLVAGGGSLAGLGFVLRRTSKRPG